MEYALGFIVGLAIGVAVIIIPVANAIYALKEEIVWLKAQLTYTKKECE